MRHLLMGVTAALSIAVIDPNWGPAWAQVPPPAAPPAAYPYAYQQRYPFPATTPTDAYRRGLINRLQLEQLEGPLPQALQGPSVDGTRAFQ
jgi:hypothetical protein